MNTNLLKAAIVAHGDTQAMLAEAIGISASNLNEKIHGKASFRQNEILTIRKRYNLSATDVDAIFFASGLS